MYSPTCEDLYLSKSRWDFHRENKRTLWASHYHQLTQGIPTTLKVTTVLRQLVSSTLFSNFQYSYRSHLWNICHHLFRSNTSNSSIWNQTETLRKSLMLRDRTLQILFLFFHSSVCRLLNFIPILILNQNYHLFFRNNLPISKTIGSFTI